MKNFIYLIAYYNKDNQLSFVYKGIKAEDEDSTYNSFDVEDKLLEEIESNGGKAVNNLVIEIPKIMVDVSKIPSSLSIEEYMAPLDI